jgi:hypothetical protein
MARAAEDEDATPAEIVEAGLAVDAMHRIQDTSLHDVYDDFRSLFRSEAPPARRHGQRPTRSAPLPALGLARWSVLFVVQGCIPRGRRSRRQAMRPLNLMRSHPWAAGQVAQLSARISPTTLEDPAMRVTYSGVTATLALALAISTGGAYAANTLAPKNSVTSKAIKNGQVTTKDLRKNAAKSAQVAPESLTGADVRTGSLTGAEVAEGSLNLSDLSAADRRTLLTQSDRPSFLTQQDRAGLLAEAAADRFDPVPRGTIVRGATLMAPNTAQGATPIPNIVLREFITPGRLPVPLETSSVAFGATGTSVNGNQIDPSKCAGGPANPAPQPGMLCIYPIDSASGTVDGASVLAGFSGEVGDAGRGFGAEMVVRVSNSGSPGFRFVWAYHAP